jgi:hypothetical protein
LRRREFSIEQDKWTHGDGCARWSSCGQSVRENIRAHMQGQLINPVRNGVSALVHCHCEMSFKLFHITEVGILVLVPSWSRRVAWSRRGVGACIFGLIITFKYTLLIPAVWEQIRVADHRIHSSCSDLILRAFFASS